MEIFFALIVIVGIIESLILGCSMCIWYDEFCEYILQKTLTAFVKINGIATNQNI